MTYSFDEQNIDRQKLLHKILSVPTERLMDVLEPAPGSQVLDLGCGIGETTRFVASRLGRDGAVVGIDINPELLAVARKIPAPGHAALGYEQSDASRLGFEDERFDLVFARYLLLHVPEPATVIAEMVRVCKRGGVIALQEPDLAYNVCYPPNQAFDKITQFCARLIPHPRVGLELLSLLRGVGLEPMGLSRDGCIVAGAHGFRDFEPTPAFDAVDLKRLYRMSVEAMGPALMAQGVMTRAEYQGLCDELHRLEESEEVLVLSNPVISIWAIKE